MVESYDTVQVIGATIYDFSERKTLRIGVSAEYAISPTLALFGGVDYIPSTFDGGNEVAPVPGGSTLDGVDEDLFNAYIGVSMKFTDYLTGTLTYNFTNSSSDIPNRDYDRNRISVGLRAEF